MKLTHITFTGIDSQTDFSRLNDISSQAPCEWGILFSRNRQGIDPRYPDQKVIDDALSTGLRFAAHLCGKVAQEVMETGVTDIDLSGFARVQVNHISPIPAMLAKFSNNIGIPVIAQWRDPAKFPDENEGISWLYDMSGGKGILANSWPINPSRHQVGYAGGLNPNNVSNVIEKLKDRSPAGFWVDMETGVRTNDYLDLDKVQAVVDNSLSHCQ